MVARGARQGVARDARQGNHSAQFFRKTPVKTRGATAFPTLRPLAPPHLTPGWDGRFGASHSYTQKLPYREAGPGGPPREKSIPELRPATRGSASCKQEVVLYSFMVRLDL